jgi:hypothetical protein
MRFKSSATVPVVMFRGQGASVSALSPVSASRARTMIEGGLPPGWVGLDDV